jgi:hypothetical protein
MKLHIRDSRIKTCEYNINDTMIDRQSAGKFFSDNLQISNLRQANDPPHSTTQNLVLKNSNIPFISAGATTILPCNCFPQSSIRIGYMTSLVRISAYCVVYLRDIRGIVFQHLPEPSSVLLDIIFIVGARIWNIWKP